MRKAGWLAATVALAVLAAGCSREAPAAGGDGVIETISPGAAADLIGAAPVGLVVLDVRTPEEFAEAHLAGAVNLDFYAATFADDLGALDRGVPYVLYCRSGNRSGEVREMMRALGFREVHEIAGGIVAWAGAGLPVAVPVP